MLTTHLAPRAKAEEGERRAHGRDYHLGTLVGGSVKAEDLEGVLRELRAEDVPFQLVADHGGEKVFLARGLPATATRHHDLEAGLLAGALRAALKQRFDVEEETCRERGDAHCRFVAVKG